MNVQRIGAWTWCLILAIAGGGFMIAALGGAPGEGPATAIAEEDGPSPVIAREPDGTFHSPGERTGITRVSDAE